MRAPGEQSRIRGLRGTSDLRSLCSTVPLTCNTTDPEECEFGTERCRQNPVTRNRVVAGTFMLCPADAGGSRSVDGGDLRNARIGEHREVFGAHLNFKTAATSRDEHGGVVVHGAVDDHRR